MSLHIKPLEEKRKRSSPPSLSSPSFSLLPNDITVNYLARIPRSYYSTLSLVSKTFYSLLSSTDLYSERSLLGNTEQCLYLNLVDFESESTHWFALCLNPNRQLLVRIPPSNFSLKLFSTVAVVSSEIYVIGGYNNRAPSSRVGILNCRSHTWHDAPSMNVPRHHAASCFYDDKIYVIGGYEGADDESWAEVFDTKTRTWERLSSPPDTKFCKSYVYNIMEIEGKIYVSNNWKTEYVYDIKQGKWKLCNNRILTRPMCVIGNVFDSCGRYCINGQLKCGWYDTNAEKWREIKGLNSLREKCMMNVNSYYLGRCELVSYGGKLLLMWEVCRMNDEEKKTWCAEVAVEKRDGGKVWGNVEWVDIMENIPSSYDLWHLLVVSL